EEIDEAAEDEDRHIDRGEEAPLTAGKPEEKVLDPEVAIDAVKGEREDTAPDQDEQLEAGKPRGRLESLAHQGVVEATLGEGQQQGTARPHGAAFGGCCNAQEDAAEHQEDEG